VLKDEIAQMQILVAGEVEHVPVCGDFDLYLLNAFVFWQVDEKRVRVRVEIQPERVEAAVEEEKRSLHPRPWSEAFLYQATDTTITICAGSARAAIHALFMVEDRILCGELEPVETPRLHVPFFHERAGGILSYAQDEPADFDAEDYACWLARHSININGVHDGRTNLTPEAAAAFEVDCMIGGSSNFFFNMFCNDDQRAKEKDQAKKWEQAHPGCIVRTQPRSHNKRRIPVLSIFTDFGRQLHKKHLQGLLAGNPRATRLLFTFGDWGSIHGDECPVVGNLPTHQRVIRWLEAIAEIADEIRPAIKIIARTWYYDAEFIQAMIDETPAGIGIREKEPAGICLDQPLGWDLEQDNYSDIMLNKYELSERYGPVYLSGGRKRRADFYPAVGMGDTDESIDPVIGIATPWMAARKLRRLAEESMLNFHVWWGGLNYDAYSPNHEVIRAFTWDPYQDPEVCIERIARRDFGDAQASSMVAFWRTVNDALEDWDYVNWKQQLETFVGRGDKMFFKPLTEAVIAESPWCEIMRPNATRLIGSQRRTVQRLSDALEQIRAIHAALPKESPARERTRQQLGWTWLLRNLLRGEYHVLEAILLCEGQLDVDGITHENLSDAQSAEEANAEDTAEALQWIGRSNFKFLSWGTADLEANLSMLKGKIIELAHTLSGTST